jgi:hypothetical protein
MGIDKNKKYYVCFDSRHPSNIYHGFHYWSWSEAIGEKVGNKVNKRFPYTEEDILKLKEKNCLSKTLFDRILEIREGTAVKLHYLHSCGNLMIRLLTEKEKQCLWDYYNTVDGISLINQAIKNKLPDLFAQLSILEKQKREIIKEGVKLGIKL